jgi:hypothetical protein
LYFILTLLATSSSSSSATKPGIGIGTRGAAPAATGGKVSCVACGKTGMLLFFNTILTKD